jgi:HPt (histidine-containing phosphotransfer) domain-containing protein
VSPPPPNSAISELAAVLGDEATREVVRLFLSEFPGSIRTLGKGSREEQVRVAHGLKSSALHMGAKLLSERMAGIEARLDTPGETISGADLAGAIAEFGAIAPLLRKYAGA